MSDSMQVRTNIFFKQEGLKMENPNSVLKRIDEIIFEQAKLDWPTQEAFEEISSLLSKLSALEYDPDFRQKNSISSKLEQARSSLDIYFGKVENSGYNLEHHRTMVLAATKAMRSVIAAESQY
ncbi:hypothetical protein JL49_13425 [Pseudoalteromonas luteoviolacea]|nr:hypothetical protein JL49_13425 [Pseudoalteromonas luteoviolacea]